MTPEYQQAKSDYEKIRDSIILQRQQDQVAAGLLRDINALKRGLQEDPKAMVKARPRQPKYVFPEPRRSKRDRKHLNYQELLDEDYPAPRTHHQAKRRKTSAAKAATEDPSQGDPKAAQVTPEGGTWNVSNCVVSPRHGNCHALEPRWFFSHWDNVCKPYNYSGCGANVNSFLSEEECQSKCPPLNFDGEENRCLKLRRRGDCTEKVERYFFDMFTEKCVKFGGCDDLGDGDNNFETKAMCMQTCLPSSDSSLALTDEVNAGSHSGTVALEVVMSLLLIGLIIVGALFGWRQYNLRRTSPDTYRLFRDQRSNSVVGVMSSSGDTSGAGGEPAAHRSQAAMSTYNNPAFSTDFREHIERRDSVVEFPALSMTNLGNRNNRDRDDSVA